MLAVTEELCDEQLEPFVVHQPMIMPAVRPIDDTMSLHMLLTSACQVHVTRRIAQHHAYAMHGSALSAVLEAMSYKHAMMENLTTCKVQIQNR